MSQWALYDQLIEGAAADDTVERVRIGASWTIVQTRAGRVGAAATQPSRRGQPPPHERYEGMSLTEAARLVKSWDFAEAAVGAAAINAAWNAADRFPPQQNPDAFLRYRDCLEGKKVAVVGHFAYLEQRLMGLCELSILERDPGPDDLPDPACEYLLPDMDAVIITGSAVANKTMPRLLELCQNAFTVVSGPSTPMAGCLLQAGADALCGFCVTDCQRALALDGCCGSIFDCGKMVCVEKGGMSA